MTTVSAKYPRLLTLTGYAGFVLIGCNLVLIPALIRSVEHDFHQTDAGLGLFYFISSLIYAFGAFSGGLLTERLGRRTVLCASVGLLGVGLLGESLAPTWPLLFVALVPTGWGAGATDGGINGLFLDLYRDARGGALNFLHLFFSIGALIGPFLFGELVTAGVSWRVIVFGVGLCALPIFGVLLAVAMPSGRHEQHAAEVRQEEISGAERSLRPFIGLALSICFYVAAEVAVSNWIVKLLAGVPVATATGILSVFWAGLALGRLLSNWLAERIDYYIFTVSCALLGALALLAAIAVPWLPLAALFFGLTGVFYGPIYPMIMALGGNIYPRRLSRLSGGLATAAVLGSTIYPPLMGLMAAQIGLRAGMVGAALLGLPMAAGLLGTRAAARQAARADSAAARAAPARRVGR